MPKLSKARKSRRRRARKRQAVGKAGLGSGHGNRRRHSPRGVSVSRELSTKPPQFKNPFGVVGRARKGEKS